MTLPLSSNALVTPAGTQGGLARQKPFLGRGTYESLNGAKTAVQEAIQGQTGKRLRRNAHSALAKTPPATAALARANALVTQPDYPPD